MMLQAYQTWTIRLRVAKSVEFPHNRIMVRVQIQIINPCKRPRPGSFIVQEVNGRPLCCQNS